MITAGNINPLKSSWECHRCHKVNAPHMDQCSCSGVQANVPNMFVPAEVTNGKNAQPVTVRDPSWRSGTVHQGDA